MALSVSALTSLLLVALLVFFLLSVNFNGPFDRVPLSGPPSEPTPPPAASAPPGGAGYTDILPNNIDDVVLPATANSFPVHLVRFYKKSPVRPDDNLCWLECVSLLSIMLYIRPPAIYVHTNHPDFWPFDSCDGLIDDWSSVKLVYRRRRFVVNGKRLNSTDKFIAHEADVAKLVTLHKYGGITSDFDVFFLPNITSVLGLLGRGYDCLVSKEETFMKKMNHGFIACHRGAAYIADILQSYRNDYRAKEWVYNSGMVPWNIHHSSAVYNRTVYVDDEIINNPGPETVLRFIRGQDRSVDWRRKPAFHSLFHDCQYNRTNATRMDTGFAELLTSILDEAHRRRPQIKGS
ncbi:uncharacterized protein LOC129595939 [Paramacrobiotus metropolitanus]|uniref:uncharacterized protein LOC129595939 n=1 Tax=Paramacrobiotus metropolitanus TaxID=2943436 RepID=UPI0024464E41|nr:uncharacterized protein LOC129595939 [Paramacrobiotus metropolitanus]